MKHRNTALVLLACSAVLSVACGTTTVDFGTAAKPDAGGVITTDSSVPTVAPTITHAGAPVAPPAPASCGVGTELSGQVVSLLDDILDVGSFTVSGIAVTSISHTEVS